MMADARLAVSLAGRQLQEEMVDGELHWFTDLPAPRVAADDRTYALPAFDEFLIGYTDRSAALDAAVSRLVIAGGMFKPVIVAGSRILGTWKRRTGRGEVVCSIAPFAKLHEATARASSAALERYARFVGLDLREGPTSPA
jgi:hypothetical protein